MNLCFVADLGVELGGSTGAHNADQVVNMSESKVPVFDDQFYGWRYTEAWKMYATWSQQGWLPEKTLQALSRVPREPTTGLLW